MQGIMQCSPRVPTADHFGRLLSLLLSVTLVPEWRACCPEYASFLNFSNWTIIKGDTAIFVKPCYQNQTTPFPIVPFGSVLQVEVGRLLRWICQLLALPSEHTALWWQWKMYTFLEYPLLHFWSIHYLKASCNSSSGSHSFIFLFIIVMNSSNSIVPFPGLENNKINRNSPRKTGYS